MQYQDIQKLIDDIAGPRWVCPQPMRWNELYEMLPAKKRVGNGWEPPLR